jgi:hypothetical protein
MYLCTVITRYSLTPTKLAYLECKRTLVFITQSPSKIVFNFNIFSSLSTRVYMWTCMYLCMVVIYSTNSMARLNRALGAKNHFVGCWKTPNFWRIICFWWSLRCEQGDQIWRFFATYWVIVNFVCVFEN